MVILLGSTSFGRPMQSIELVVNGGFGLPAGPAIFIDRAKLGYNFGGGLSYTINHRFSVDLLFDYNRFQFDRFSYAQSIGRPVDQDVPDTYIIEGGPSEVISIALQGRWYMFPGASDVLPYLLGGAGYMSFAADVVYHGNTIEALIGDPADPGFEQDALYSAIGLGFDFPRSDRIVLFIEGRYSLGFTDERIFQYFPFKLGFRFVI